MPKTAWLVIPLLLLAGVGVALFLRSGSPPPPTDAPPEVAPDVTPPTEATTPEPDPREEPLSDDDPPALDPAQPNAALAALCYLI